LRRFAVDELEKREPFLMAMFGHAGADQSSLGHIKRGKERRCTMRDRLIPISHRWPECRERAFTLYLGDDWHPFQFVPGRLDDVR